MSIEAKLKATDIEVKRHIYALMDERDNAREQVARLKDVRDGIQTRVAHLDRSGHPQDKPVIPTWEVKVWLKELNKAFNGPLE